MKNKGGTQTEDVKALFDDLRLEQKSVFLIDAIFSTAASALDEIGKRALDLINDLAPSEDTAEPEPAAPKKTTRKRTPRKRTPKRNA